MAGRRIETNVAISLFALCAGAVGAWLLVTLGTHSDWTHTGVGKWGYVCPSGEVVAWVSRYHEHTWISTNYKVFRTLDEAMAESERATNNFEAECAR